MFMYIRKLPRQFMYIILALAFIAAILNITSIRRNASTKVSFSPEQVDAIRTLLKDLAVHQATHDIQYNPASEDAVNNRAPTERQPNQVRPERRRSLLIFGADRSGTTFISTMFAEDPQMFMVYEPLWIPLNWRGKEEGQGNWTRDVLDVVNAILTCKFAASPKGTKFLGHTTHSWTSSFAKFVFTSPAFCNEETKSCPTLAENPGFADDVCRTKFKHSVTKVNQGRVPDKLISLFIPTVINENPDTDIRVLQIVRDPRGCFNSRINGRWMGEYQTGGFVGEVRYVCKLLAENIKIGRNLPSTLRDKYMEVHYRDIANSPVETAKKIYKFAGFELTDEVVQWVVSSTKPSEEDLKEALKNPFSSKRNSSANAEKWRQESPIERVRIIERECDELLRLLGLDKVTSD